MRGAVLGCDRTFLASDTPCALYALALARPCPRIRTSQRRPLARRAYVVCVHVRVVSACVPHSASDGCKCDGDAERAGHTHVEALESSMHAARVFFL